MKSTHAALGILVGLAAFAAAPREAKACGGCFAPPEYPTVVTDHRMIFTVAHDQSSLYDQIKYTGNPASFAWVLPFAGDIQVGVSSDTVFSALDGLTQTRILPPPTNCPSRPSDCSSPFASAKSAPTAAEDSAGGGVDVLKHEVVGPYETVQLKATDSDALQKWLGDHGYHLPDDVRPVVTAYQNEHFNFLALKLVPGQGVTDMRPVRVTTKGSNVALPLRMVAAGTGATVGITLWVIAEGRYHPSNFGVFDIKADELVWDWSQQKSNFTDLRTQRTAAGGGRAWEVESSSSIPRTQIQQYFGYYGPYAGEDDASAPYLPEKDAQGTVTKTAQQVQSDDFEALFHGIPNGSERITRLRADLAHAALDQDLLVAAAADQTALPSQRQVIKELGEPQCPVYDGCEQKGTAPRSQAIEQTDDNNSGCKIIQREGARESWLVIALGFVGLSLGRKYRRGRR
jgi:hypothetical protein